MFSRKILIPMVVVVAVATIVLASYYIVQTVVKVSTEVKKGSIEINLPTIVHSDLVGGDVDVEKTLGTIRYQGDLGLKCFIKISDIPDDVIAGGFTVFEISRKRENVPPFKDLAWAGVVIYFSSKHVDENTNEVNVTWVCQVINLTCISNLFNCYCKVINDTSIKVKPPHGVEKSYVIDFSKLPKCTSGGEGDLCYVLPLSKKVIETEFPNTYNIIVESTYPIYLPGNLIWDIAVVNHVVTEYVDFTQEQTFELKIDFLCNPPIS